MQTLKKTKRRHLDAYPTNQKLTQALLDRVNIEGRVLEPCAGDGKISDYLISKGYNVTATDIVYPFAYPTTNTNDATDELYWQSFPARHDWVITNPPFNQAHLILPLAYKYAQIGVALLLRLSFLEPAGNKGDWLSKHQISNLIIFGQPRPSFTDDGKTDSCTVAWMVWRKYPANTSIQFVMLNPKK